LIRHFLNLTNGIEAIERFDLKGEQIEFVRIASTDCEHKLGAPQWDAILRELDSSLAMALARGDLCLIYDYSRDRDLSHALTYGVAWIRFALTMAWFGTVLKPLEVDGEDLSAFFARQWSRHTSKRAKRKLLYFRNFVELDLRRIDLRVLGGRTTHDGDWPYYRGLLKNVGR
jgi:hypothetical protein